MQVLAILVITVLVAAIAHFAFERGAGLLAERTKTDLDDRIVAAVKGPVILTILLGGLGFGAGGLSIFGDFREHISSGIVTVLAVFWGAKLIDIAVLVVLRFGKRLGYAADFLVLCANLAKIVVWLIVFLLVLSAWGVDITPLLASAGIAGIALGLGAQETLSNIFSGVAIILDKPYKVRDYIIVQGAGERGELRGKVLDIGMRSTKIKTRDNIYLTIPNSVMGNSVIVNETGKDKPLRVRVGVGVAYGSDITKVEQALLKAVYEVDEGKENIVGKKGFEPKVRFREFGDSALLFELLVWIKEPELKGEMVHYLNRAVLEALRREKIEIPFPQRVVRIKK